MRGGTSKGVFFAHDDLPAHFHADTVARDRLLLRLIGSPDAYGKQIDGMGNGTSSTSKVVIVRASTRADCDLEYWFGAISIHAPVIDWSGNCGNLTAAVAPFAIARGLIRVVGEGIATVRMWQANLGKHIIAHVPMQAGEVMECGDFMLDGVAFPSAEIKLEFLSPGAEDGEDNGAMFPTGHLIDRLEVPGLGAVEATLINAGNPTVFIDASTLSLRGTELQAEVNNDPALLARCEAIRAHAAVVMGLAPSAQAATNQRPATPKLCFLAPPAAYVSSGGRSIAAGEIDLLARILSMGVLHHAMTGTGSVAIAVAAAIPGTLVHRLAQGKGGQSICFGHPSGTMRVGAEASAHAGAWTVRKAVMSRSARRLMDGMVFVPPH
jgi:2-methylaconitate isomerase